MEHELWYKEEAKVFEEALPIGNGKLGAMVYGGKKTEKLSLNYDELWSGKPGMDKREGAYEAYKKIRELVFRGRIEQAQRTVEEDFTCGWDDMYLPMCDLYIEGLNGCGKFRRSLDLKEGVARVICGDTERTYFCSKPHGALYIRIVNEPGMTLRLKSLLKYDVIYKKNGISLKGECPDSRIIPEESPNGKGVPFYNGEGIRFEVSLAIKTDGKTDAGDGVKISDATYVDIRISAASSYGKDIKEHSIYPDFDDAYKAHIKDFSELYNRVRLELCGGKSDMDTAERLINNNNDKGLIELMFNYGRYLIISASREGSEAMNLQGIWNERLFPPWNSNYTLNINLEMNYWPVLMCDLPECYLPLIELIKKISKMGKATAKEMYNARGFASHHNADLWGKTAPVGNRMEGSGRYAFWNGSVGWLSAMLFEYYEYTLDRDYLEKTAFPIIKEAVLFYLDIMTEYEGKYIVSPSTSPENLYKKNGTDLYLAKWTTMTQTIVYDLFEIFVMCSGILGAEKELAAKISKMMPKVNTLTRGSRGQLLEWDEEYEQWDAHHRHVSHLYGLYPGRTITSEGTPELADACKQTLTERTDAGTGWSIAWKANLWAKLKDGNRAFALMQRQLTYTATRDIVDMSGGTYTNLFDAHPPFQIDGNFGITSAIAQMLMQCEDGKIKILPALPKALPEGSVEGLCAKGGVKVDIRWKNNKAEEVTLYSNDPVKVTVVMNGCDIVCKTDKGKKCVLKDI